MLYVDDNVADRILLTRALVVADAPIRLLAVEDGNSGIEAALLYRPAVILLDLNMPRDSGEEILVRIKKDRRIRDIPVVVFSGEDNLVRALQVRELGAAEYLVKPNGLRELAQAVIAVVERQAG